MELIKPSSEHKEKALAYRQAHFDFGEHAIDGDNGLDDAVTYEDWLESIREIEAGRHEFLIPSSTYFAVIDGEFVGVADIRHRLNDGLLKIGGHVGYSVRPNHRRKGYATEILRLALEKCKEMEMDKVLVTCNKDNIGSQKTILNNGGILENEHIGENGIITLRYWIEV